MYLTVLCLSYTLGTSPFFPPKSFYCLDHWTTKKNKKNKKKKKEEKKRKYKKSKKERTQRMLGQFHDDKRSTPHYLFKVMHLLGNVMFFYVYKNKCFTSPVQFSVIFSWQKGYMVAFTKRMLSVCLWRLQRNHRYAFYFTCVQVWIYYE